MLAPSNGESHGSGNGVLPAQLIKCWMTPPLGGEISPEFSKFWSALKTRSIELVEGGKFLLNPRNGYKYPIRSGIPVMLIEEGKKHRDINRVASNGAA